jgi:hypothetical protein
MVHELMEHTFAVLERGANLGILCGVDFFVDLRYGVVKQFDQRAHFFVIQSNLHGILRGLKILCAMSVEQNSLRAHGAGWVGLG